ncbi:MAG: TRAP transporter TatT component family protein [Gammaproteobacteria bacterium]
MIGSAASTFAGDLSTAILSQDDPELVRESLPAYLILLDSQAAKPDAGADLLGAAASLYAAYAVLFVDDPDRAATLASHARVYGERAACKASAAACNLSTVPFAEVEARLDRIRPRESSALFSYAVGALAYVRTHSDDWQAVADLPRIEAVLNRLLDIGDPVDAGTVNSYLGILNTLRPEALGGHPEQGKAYFERAIALTNGQDLSVLVDYARSYARLVYDRDLYDTLLKRVLAADPHAGRRTLFNTLAQEQAKALLAAADDYF